MKVIKSTDRVKLENLNKRINDYMITNVKNYNATQWGSIIKHPDRDEWILKIRNDPRNPRSVLTQSEKLELVTQDVREWKKIELDI